MVASTASLLVHVEWLRLRALVPAGCARDRGRASAAASWLLHWMTVGEGEAGVRFEAFLLDCARDEMMALGSWSALPAPTVASEHPSRSLPTSA